MRRFSTISSKSKYISLQHLPLTSNSTVSTPSALEASSLGKISLLKFDNKPVNALTPEFLKDFKSQLENIHSSSSVKALILSSELPKVFSAGLDLKTLVAHEKYQLQGIDGLSSSASERNAYKDHIRSYMKLFGDVTKLLLTIPQPTVTLVKGMAPAGGTVLSLCTDYRIGSDAGFTMGLNEVQVGMAPPLWVHHLMLHAVGHRYSVQAMQRGQMFKPEQCLSIGLVHKIVPDAKLLESGITEIKSYLSLPQTARIDAKMKSIQHIVDHFNDDALDQVVKSIAGPEFQKTCKGILASLAKK